MITMWRKRKVTAFLIGLLILVCLIWFMVPRPELYANTSFSNAVHDRNGHLLRLTLAEDQRYRLFVPLRDVAPHAIEATLLYEDQYFYDHPGVNVGALVRAAWTTYVKRSRRMGASTITMQLARMRFDLNTRTIPGKLNQIFRALQLERHYTKRDILEAYLNLAPYGGNVEGIGTASLIYFDKAAKALTLPEALALVVVPQNPALRAPTRGTKLPALYKARQRLTALWQEKHVMSDEQIALMNLPLSVRHTNQLPFKAPHFVLDVLASGPTDTTAMQTRTTLSLSLQRTVESTMNRYLDRRQSSGLSNASALLIDTRSMHVLASVGSADFFDADISGQVDGTRAKRSPGSTLKPFVYGLALDQGLIHPSSLLSDAPKRFGVYTPENFDRGFMGPVLATEALIYSRNVPAIELLNQVGLNDFHNLLESASVKQLKSAEHYGLAMVLGGNELTMHELIALYAMLANGGKWQAVRTTAESPLGPTRQLLSPEASFLVLDMLRQNPRPNDIDLNRSTHNFPVAWKTGTSYAYRDAWTVGVVGHYALAVWVGNFDGSANASLVGRQAAAPLFFEVVDALATVSLGDQNAEDELLLSDALPPPGLNLKKVEICSGTGDLPNQHCPETELGWFIPGVSPIKVSSVYRPVRIDTRSGLRACDTHSTHTVEHIYQFWPSDLDRLFRQAGIAIEQPPAFSPDCENTVHIAGAAPTITSPARKLTYQIQLDSDTIDALPFTANTDADVSSLFWFVDNQFVAEVKRDEPFLWKPRAGNFDILVVDDLGRSDAHRYSFELAQ